MANFDLDTTELNRIIKLIETEHKGVNLLSLGKMAQPDNPILATEASCALFRARDLFKLTCAVRKAQSPHSLTVNPDMERIALVMFDAQSEGLNSLTANEIAYRIANQFDEVGGNPSSFHWLSEHGVIKESEGSYSLDC